MARTGFPCVPEPVTTAADDELLAAIGTGDAAAFGRWLAGAEDRLRGSLRSFAERVDVEAVLQETLVRVWQLAPRVVPDGRPHALLRLAIRIARNLAVSDLRRRRLEPVEADILERLTADAQEFSPGPDRWRDPLLRRAIEECRQRLPARPAQALNARLASAGAEPDARIAEGVGMRLNTFLQNIVRARRLLADCLRRRGIDLALELA
jgi:DNA-directed RNA polymerase specialized sigma24 family protein